MRTTLILASILIFHLGINVPRVLGDELETSLEEYRSSLNNYSNCLGRLGIPYGDLCDEATIDNIVNKHNQTGHVPHEPRYEDDEELALNLCRSYPHMANCENRKCICILAPAQDCIDPNFEKPESCRKEYDEHEMQWKKHNLLHDEDNSGDSLKNGGNQWKILYFTAFVFVLFV